MCDVGVCTCVHTRVCVCVRAWRHDRGLQEAREPGDRGTRWRSRRAHAPVTVLLVRAALPEMPVPGGPRGGQPPGAGRVGLPLWGGFVGRAVGPVLEFTCLWAGLAPGDAAFPTEPRGLGWAGCGPWGRAKTVTPAWLRGVCLGTGSWRGASPVPGCVPVRQAQPLVLRGAGNLPVWGERRAKWCSEPESHSGRWGEGRVFGLRASCGPGARLEPGRDPLQRPVGQGPLGNPPRTLPATPARLGDRSEGGFGSQETRRKGRVNWQRELSYQATTKSKPHRRPSLPSPPSPEPRPSCLQPVFVKTAGRDEGGPSRPPARPRPQLPAHFRRPKAPEKSLL